MVKIINCPHTVGWNRSVQSLKGYAWSKGLQYIYTSAMHVILTVHAFDEYISLITTVPTAYYAAIHSSEHLSRCEVMWGQTLSWASRKQQCCSKFSSNAGKVQRLPWQAGKNIGKMNCEHGNCSSLSCSKRPGQLELGLVEHGGGGDCGLHWRWQGWTGYLLPT